MSPITLASPLSDLGWFDITGLAVLLVFACLGLVKGLPWQLSRLGVIVAAYAAALLFADRLAPALDRWLAASGDPELSLHVARLTLFVGVVTLVGLLVWFVQRFVPPRPVSRLSRLFGAGVGVVLGGLIMLALVTVASMLLPGRGVARAAESSRSAEVGRGALRLAERVLPAELGASARVWRELISPSPVDARNGTTPDGTTPDGTGGAQGQPIDGAFRSKDGAAPAETPRKSVAPQKR